MTDNQSNKPSHIIYAVTGEGDDADWKEIGAMWPHKDGKGFNSRLSAVPHGNARLVMRDAAEAQIRQQPKAA